jgi:hypothetical protein
VSPVSAVRANGVAQLTGYAAAVRIRLAILVTLAACVGGSLGGCKDHDVDRLTAVKRDVCACKDARCADQAMSEVPKTAIRSTPRVQAIARDIMECRARLEAADRPSTDPDAEGLGEPAPAGGGAGSAPAPAAAAPAPPEPAAPKPAAPKPAPPKPAR